MKDIFRKLNPILATRSFRERFDLAELQEYLKKHYPQARPNSDSSIELWALSALINARSTCDEHTEEVVEAFNNGFAAGEEKGLQFGMPRQVKIPVDYIVGEDVNED